MPYQKPFLKAPGMTEVPQGMNEDPRMARVEMSHEEILARKARKTGIAPTKPLKTTLGRVR